VRVILVCPLSLSACDWGKDAHSEIKLSNGIIEIDRTVEVPDLLESVLGIRRGTPASVVSTTLGIPFAKVGSRGDTCWVYQAGSSVDALDFCINRQQRVTRILVGAHG